jgi:amylosucrase
VYNFSLHQDINTQLQKSKLDLANEDNLFYTRFMANAAAVHALYMDLYSDQPHCEEMFHELIQTIITSYKKRSPNLKKKDAEKLKEGYWFLSNQLAGMSLYVDRFCGDLPALGNKLDYFKKLGVNFLHLMPLFQSPRNESDGGYAVSDFRKLDTRFGTLDDLKLLQEKMDAQGMYLMIDIVLNHTSHHHKWAKKARQGEAKYQDYFYMYPDRAIPDEFEKAMPEIFPESAPGNFTYIKECDKWAMTVFHNYQWDLNYTNPHVFVEMLDNILFYANLGVDMLRIDAPAFIWKQIGTTCQNLPKAHTILQLIKQCTNTATPGMALLAEAIVEPVEIMKYFGTGLATAKECDFAYNATHMALQWDALATGDTRIMLAAQHDLSRKPYGTSWITYTRCHDDIGLGYNDYMIEQAGFNAFEHRKFLMQYYSGNYKDSPARGSLFSANAKTLDARISGSLASLCGLEKALHDNDENEVNTAINRILLMQAHSFFIGGIPMIFYGDEAGYTNDYSYLLDPGKNYDNRWMHRPIIDWEKNKKIEEDGSVEHKIFTSTQRLIGLRKKIAVAADHKNLTWLTPHNLHVAGYIRTARHKELYCLFNFGNRNAFLTWYIFKEHGHTPLHVYDHWKEQQHVVGADHEYLVLDPYQFCLLEPA